jgi:hypothetical protein
LTLNATGCLFLFVTVRERLTGWSNGPIKCAIKCAVKGGNWDFVNIVRNDDVITYG